MRNGPVSGIRVAPTSSQKVYRPDFLTLRSHGQFAERHYVKAVTSAIEIQPLSESILHTAPGTRELPPRPSDWPRGSPVQRRQLAGDERVESAYRSLPNAITRSILERAGFSAFTSSALSVSAKSPSAKPGNQVVADWFVRGSTSWDWSAWV
jgi:hypothetical protein